MCRLRLFYECSDGSMGFAEHVMRYEDDIVGFIKHWKTGGRMVITEHIDLVQREIMKLKYQGDYKGKWTANLMIKNGLYKVVSFNSFNRAKLWAKKEVKRVLELSLAEDLDTLSINDVAVRIDERKIIGYEISSEEILKNSERVL